MKIRVRRIATVSPVLDPLTGKFPILYETKDYDNYWQLFLDDLKHWGVIVAFSNLYKTLFHFSDYFQTIGDEEVAPVTDTSLDKDNVSMYNT